MTVPLQSVETAQKPTSLSGQQIRYLADRGVELCRQGEWKKGFQALSAVAESEHREGELPSMFHSYLGYGVARYRKDYTAALALANHATERRFFEPENFLNLARIYLLAGNRRQAFQSCVRGLKLDPRHSQLRYLLRHMGRRRRPLFAFLPRNHAVNRVLGQVSHRIRSST